MQEGGSQFPAGAAGPPPPPPASELATVTPISVRLPVAAAGSSATAGNGFDQINVVVERSESGCASPPGNRWPRQETMALLKIRSDMDPVFQEATLKAPLWEHVSRKLAEEGYQRSAKKCKEKFENVFKYYKRTKEARAGKSYRFFSQLEALRTSSSAAAAAAPAPALLPPIVSSSSAAAAAGGMVNIGASSSGAAAAAPSQHTLLPASTVPAAAPAGGDIDPNSPDTSSFSGTESEGGGGRKRKREAAAEEESGKMMAFFEGLIQQVMDQQEAMLERFLEAIERREQNRMIREEAWRRQEKSRLSREHELAAQERAAAASRDDAIISFLQKLTGQKIPNIPPPLLPQQPPPPPPPQSASAAEETPTPVPPPPPPPQDPDPAPVLAGSSSARTAATDQADKPLILSSRWPKSQVHALIQLRSGMESRYQESNPKGPLWEEISAGMSRLGYNRSAKRCKEKWENINKYFKKVKESNKSRPEDAKTCPYFHQLDALYRTKLLTAGGGSSSPGAAAQNLSTDDDHLAMIISSPSKQQDDASSFFEQGSSSKPEDIVKKKKKKMMMMLMEQQAIVEPESFQFRIVQHIYDAESTYYIVEELDRTTNSRPWSGRDLFLSYYIYIYISIY